MEDKFVSNSFALLEFIGGIRVHPLTHIDYDCTLGKNTVVRQFCSITRESVLGANCSVAPNTSIDGSVFGDRCKIMHNCSINPGSKFGNDCFVGPNVSIANDLWPRSDSEGFRIDIFDDPDTWSLIVEDNVSIGTGARIMPGVRIGEGAMIGANAIVTKDVPPWHLWTNTGDLREIDRSLRYIRNRIAV